ncbi:MAG TPA: hypothetical protein VKQ36_15425, partial [Ktedonobacterales bacterium]|nr:hypothetical protein [Ktedonobacterales bacterium]
TTTADLFWSDMKSQSYSDILNNLLSPTVRIGTDPTQFNLTADTADRQYGAVTADTLTTESGDLTQNATLVYTVTRTQGKQISTYATTLTMIVVSNSWVISDYGSAFTPASGGAKPVGTQSTTPSVTPSGSTTPTG